MRFNILPINKVILTILICFLMILVWYYGKYSEQFSTITVPNLITDTLSCKTNATNNQDTFIVFITDKEMSEALLTSLCKNPAINRQYGEVKIQWSHNEQETIQYVGKGIADLALVKENVMQAFATQSTHGYKVVAHYRDYSTYLISLREKPRIDKQYLWGKKLGLLDYPSSRSGHIIPKKMLTELGMTADDLTIVYANSHTVLRELLTAGEVDIISSFWQEQDKERFSANYITPIQSNVSGSKWYLKMETENTDLLCEVQTSLANIATQTQSHYYRQLILEPLCGGELSKGSPKL